MQLINYIKILRPLNLLISALCVLLCAFILNQLSTGILPLMYTILLLAGFSNIINDIMDYKIDQKNQMNRPIALQVISIRNASIYALILFMLACLIIIIYQFNNFVNIQKKRPL